MEGKPIQDTWSSSTALPDAVHRLRIDEKEIYLVGTAHVSEQSVRDVRETIETLRPESVCVELDEGRYRNLIDSERWKKTNIVEVIRAGKAMLLLISLVMASFQRRIGKKLGVKPGAEMAEAVKAAKDVGAEVVLADRDIQVTLRRTWRNLGFMSRLKMTSELAASLFISEDIDAATVEELKEQAKLADLLQLLAREFPMVKGPLIDERDTYLAQKIRNAPGQRIVAVVGAGHVSGVSREIRTDSPLEPLETVPEPSWLGKALKWAFPAFVLVLFAYGFATLESERSLESVYLWILITGSLSALGATLALGHPLTILSAFLAAPLTTLHPLLAAGWVSGLVQAFVRKPTVADLEDLPEAITTARGFWLNPVSRILLVVALTNLGGALGALLAGGWIAARLVG